ncbi:hypothetical protein BDL97_03G054900 [Sphagnum fallax]|nr:hypothetical protein BDL97_03G054900 [Sphagnum fallax]
MTATGAGLSLALNTAAASPYPSSAVVLQPCASLNSQRTLQWDSVVGENYSNKKKVFKAFSTSSSSSSSSLGATTGLSLRFPHQQRCKEKRVPLAQASAGKEPLRIMISGAPASGKGTQCELIAAKYGLTHISAGDLLRAEVAAGTDSGNKAQEYMQKGMLVPDEIVVTMVKNKLLEAVDQSGGWLLDGYPRSLSQAEALDALNIRPQLFILLDVPDEVLVQRSVGRRYDPVTGKIYHLMYAPPETPEIAARLTHRLDDTEEKVKLRLQTHKANVAAVTDSYKDVITHVDGDRPKAEVFTEIDKLLSELQEGETNKDSWKGIPTRLNTCPYTSEMRSYFYRDVCEATQKAVEDGHHKLRVQITIPELDPEVDVHRIGTLLELMRELAFTFANDGKRVRVCVQGSMGEGIFSGIPLQLAGVRRMLEVMDWGSYDAKGTFINIGAVGANEVQEEDDMFIITAPQNAVGNCIIDDLKAMVNAAGNRPVIIVNPRLKDVPGSGGVMQTMGRDKRMEFAESFYTCYNFRLLYTSGTLYPILGALRMAYPGPYEVHKRFDTTPGHEEYSVIATFDHEPTRSDIGDALYGRLKKSEVAQTGFWGFFTGLLN